MLFEAINLVIHLGHTTDLLPQACGLLGRFISIREANIRYLGLETMARLSIAQPDTMEALKKHQSTILFSCAPSRPPTSLPLGIPPTHTHLRLRLRLPPRSHLCHLHLCLWRRFDLIPHPLLAPRRLSLLVFPPCTPPPPPPTAPRLLLPRPSSLKDQDISIRRRALDLVYSMCDTSTVRETVAELLSYLETADMHLKEELVLKIAILAERYRVSDEWWVACLLPYTPSSISHAEASRPRRLVFPS